MNNILIASPDQTALEQFVSGLNTGSEVQITRVDGCKQALAKIKTKKFDLFVVDENLSDTKGLECIEKTLFENAFLNTAAISRLSAEKFHEQSEGLGVLMQIPVNPDLEDGEKLIMYLKKILQRTQR